MVRLPAVGQDLGQVMQLAAQVATPPGRRLIGPEERRQGFASYGAPFGDKIAEQCHGAPRTEARYRARIALIPSALYNPLWCFGDSIYASRAQKLKTSHSLLCHSRYKVLVQNQLAVL